MRKSGAFAVSMPIGVAGRALLVSAVLGCVLPTWASVATADPGDCSQPISPGSSPAASDCLFILRAAVGSSVCDPQCVCDPNAVDLITAPDALLCLRYAVGQDVDLMCACRTCGFFLNSHFDYAVSAQLENGWTFENISGGGWQPSGGDPGPRFILNQAGELATDPVLRQTVDGLEEGQLYQVSGVYRSYASAFGDPLKMDAFRVTVEPQPQDHESIVVLGLPRPSPDPNEWTPFSVVFQASASTVTVSFFAEVGGDDSSFEVDNLCLATPL